MKHKISELEGPLLDAAVALASGIPFEMRKEFGLGELACFRVFSTAEASWTESGDLEPLRFSTSWAHGGPILDRELIATYVERCPARESELWVGGYNLAVEQGEVWEDGTGASPAGLLLDYRQTGPTRLVAGLRSYVDRKLGIEVELP